MPVISNTNGGRSSLKSVSFQIYQEISSFKGMTNECVVYSYSIYHAVLVVGSTVAGILSITFVTILLVMMFSKSNLRGMFLLFFFQKKY